MQITETMASQQATGTTASAEAKKTELGKDAFLKMLITQLRHQDPMSPMKDSDFIAQLAQFSTLEQLQNLTKQFQALSQTQLAGQALSLIGKKIQALDPEGGDPISGVVTAVKFAEGVPYLMVGESEVDLPNVTSVE